jgi:glycine/D-amino acid oxidase-like deaminating enzyme
VKASFDLLEQLCKSGVTPAPPVKIDSLVGYRAALRASPEVNIGSLPPLAYFNGHSGWSAARNAMLAVAAKCRTLGVRFQAGLVDSLIIETTASGIRDVRGARLTGPDAAEIRASELVVLAAGSWSASIFPELATDVLATGQVIATVEVTPEEYEQYKSAVSSSPYFSDVSCC